MKQRSVIQSLNWAVDGLVYALRTQRNMRIHFVAAFFVILASLFFRLERWELIAILFAITLVIGSELVNTAVEKTIDLVVEDDEHEFARFAKDMAAAAVLISAATALFVGYLVFFKRINPGTMRVLTVVAGSPPYLTGIALMLAFGIAVVLKVVIGEGTVFRGGWPSAHGALAGALFATIAFLSQDFLVATLALFLAGLVLQARVEYEVHSWFEVLSGGALGVLTTTLLFQFFYFQ